MYVSFQDVHESILISQVFLKDLSWDLSFLTYLLMTYFIFIKKCTLYNYADDNTLSFHTPDFDESQILIDWFSLMVIV